MNIRLITRTCPLGAAPCLLAALAPVLLASFAPAALAQTASVSATVTGYTALENRRLTEADRVPLAVTRSDRPNHAEASGEGGRLEPYPSQFGFASTSSVGFASAEPGVLRLFGGVRAVATDYTFPGGIPSAPSGFNVAAQVTVSASFTDVLTVSVPALALGTLVRIPFRYLAEVQSDLPLGYPPFSVHPISVVASFQIPGLGPQTFSTESGFFPWTRTTLANGNGLYVVRSDPFEVDVPVGVALPISAFFTISGQETIGDPNRQTDVGGFADGRNTAALWLGTLADGITVTSASGHDYTVDPATIVTTPVPEPESYVLLLAGIGVLGVIARRRRSCP